MLRRRFLQISGASLGLGLLPTLLPKGLGAGFAAYASQSQGAASIPILMFHKVEDNPRYPEDISSHQLEVLLQYIWNQGFCPVNISDILDNKVDFVVPKGLKPVGISADDSHRSILFSSTNYPHPEQRNARAFVDIFSESLKPVGRAPRATLFMSAVGDDRYSGKAESYFGGYMPLAQALEKLRPWPGLEIGYHTRTHTNMSKMGAVEVKNLLDDQTRDFNALGVLSQVSPILAYPYGVLPCEQGMAQLRNMGFKGAVLAFPGIMEAKYTQLDSCKYENGRLLTDPFLLPRVCIGAHIYTPKNSLEKTDYLPIDPVEDLRKDVLLAMPKLYVSQGKAG